MLIYSINLTKFLKKESPRLYPHWLCGSRGFNQKLVGLDESGSADGLVLCDESVHVFGERPFHHVVEFRSSVAGVSYVRYD